MKKLDNFINCLAVLASADFKMAETNDIYRTGFISDSEVWLLMLKKRNTSVHIYNEDEVESSWM